MRTQHQTNLHLNSAFTSILRYAEKENETEYFMNSAYASLNKIKEQIKKNESHDSIKPRIKKKNYSPVKREIAYNKTVKTEASRNSSAEVKCSKNTYPSRRMAQTILNAIKKSRGHKGEKDKRPRRSYQCEKCAQWHLTSQV
jgi:hypothetical protein